MLYSELNNYFVQSQLYDLADQFDQGVAILEHYDACEYMDVFDLVYGQHAFGEEQALIDAFRNALVTMLDDILQAQGVVLIPEAELGIKLAILSGLSVMAQYESQEEILAILDCAENHQEAFGEVLSLLTRLSTENVLSYTESVSDGLIDVLKKLAVAQHHAEEETKENIDKQIKDYLIYKAVLRQSSVYPDLYFKHTESIGLPYLVYLQGYLANTNSAHAADVPKENLKNTIQDKARTLFGFACLSKESSDAALPTIRKYLDLVYSSLDIITQLDMALIQLNTEFHNAKV